MSKWDIYGTRGQHQPQDGWRGFCFVFPGPVDEKPRATEDVSEDMTSERAMYLFAKHLPVTRTCEAVKVRFDTLETVLAYALMEVRDGKMMPIAMMLKVEEPPKRIEVK